MQVVDGRNISWVRGHGISSRRELGICVSEYPDYVNVKGRNETLLFHRAQPTKGGFEYRNVRNGKVISFIMK